MLITWLSSHKKMAILENPQESYKQVSGYAYLCFSHKIPKGRKDCLDHGISPLMSGSPVI